MNIKLDKFFPSNFKINYSYQTNNLIYIEVISLSKFSCCPCCGEKSNKIHSRYTRVFNDLPIIHKKLGICFISKKFFCKNNNCSRKIFTERFNGFLKPYARRTNRLTSAIKKIAFTNNAQTASKLIKTIITFISSSTILRIIRANNLTVTSNYKAVGIDDWAFKKGNTYGTLICDLETNKPIEILKDRSKETLEKWLKQHPTIKIITRDRANAYSAAVTNILPKAIQIADRFHLMKNLIDTIKEIIDSKYTNGLTLIENESGFLKENIKKQLQEPKHSKIFLNKLEIIKKVKKLYDMGLSKTEISRQTSLDRRTISKYVNMKELPKQPTKRYKPSKLDEYIDEIKVYVNQGIQATKIYKIIKEKGFNGSYSLVKIAVSKIKYDGSCINHNIKSIKIDKQNLLKLLCKYPNNLTDRQRDLLIKVKDNSEELTQLKIFIDDFYLIFKSKVLNRLYTWINEAKESNFKKLNSFANGLLKDITAVSNAVKYSFSNGVLEGNVNRLKLIKRQMYGRAKFDLIKQKVLYHI